MIIAYLRTASVEDSNSALEQQLRAIEHAHPDKPIDSIIKEVRPGLMVSDVLTNALVALDEPATLLVQDLSRICREADQLQEFLDWLPATIQLFTVEGENTQITTHQRAQAEASTVELQYRRLFGDMQQRAQLGAAHYGTYLRVHNGRHPLVDAYQEAIDLIFYLVQDEIERLTGIEQPLIPAAYVAWNQPAPIARDQPYVLNVAEQKFGNPLLSPATDPLLLDAVKIALTLRDRIEASRLKQADKEISGRMCKAIAELSTGQRKRVSRKRKGA